MLAKNPEDRFQTPAELLKALKALPPQASDGEPLRLPRAHGADLSAGSSTVTPSTGLPPPSSDKSSDLVTMTFPETPDEKPLPARPRPRHTEDNPALLQLNPEHLQTAARQYELAEEARNGNLDYAIELLLKCVKFDPVSIAYRQALCEATQAAAPQRGLGGWFTSLTTLTTCARVTAARRARLFRRVLDEGEEVLVRHPGDVKIQMAMAESAKELGLDHLAVWMLTELRRQDPRYLPAQRALASIYERQGQYSDAIAVWEEVRKVAPHDVEAAKKINDLAASETIARGNYRR